MLESELGRPRNDIMHEFFMEDGVVEGDGYILSSRRCTKSKYLLFLHWDVCASRLSVSPSHVSSSALLRLVLIPVQVYLLSICTTEHN
jgi:hypothetical protein